jgi:recombination protein RecA
MPTDKRRKLESAVAAIQQRHGPQAIRKAAEVAPAAVPHISTGFPALDAVTGCAGIPLGAITLLSGQSTSGKLTLAYKTLANAQAWGNAVLLDLARTADPGYLHRCGVRLDRLLVVRPDDTPGALVNAVTLLLDLAQSGEVRGVLVDGLADLAAESAALRRLTASLAHLRQLLRAANCALVFTDEAHAPWQRWLDLDPGAAVRGAAALHVELQRERWLRREGQLVGYSARAKVLRSRWRSDAPQASIEIVFNGTVRAQQTW